MAQRIRIERICLASFLIVGPLLWATQSARAQSPQARSRVFVRLPVPALTQIALKEAVLKELGIERDDPRIARIDQLRQASRKQLSERVHGANRGGGIRGAKLHEIAVAVRGENDAKLKELLAPAEFNRLKQIAWQLAEPKAVADEPELIEALALTKEQQAKLHALFRDRPVPGTAVPPQRRSEAELATLRREMLAEQQKKVDGVLSKTQQDKFAQLKGKPVDLELFRHSDVWNGIDRTPDTYRY